ncbi:MAG: histidinol dehydrogenase [Polyangiaceae bacterium]|nr:histidinol dehydrogenase [Polyangiaceae bacterium]
MLRVFTDGSRDFEAALAGLVRRGDSDHSQVEPAVRQILAAVRQGGDRAVRELVQRFEGRSPDPLVERDYGGEAALAELPPEVHEALVLARDRITRYHEAQRVGLEGFELDAEGVRLASRVLPLGRVGVYVPGGKARYPSSVLMSALVARVAGVEQIVVATPDASPEVRAACHLSGVTELLNAGGAQAIAALAYGTESVARVDKIVGPGNLYVAAAKRLVFGEVDIDSIAGPSEILVIADHTARGDWVAADLLSQAEHDEAAYPILLSTDPSLVERVVVALGQQLATLPRHAIAETSLRERGLALLVADRARLVQLANQLAAEHVALHVGEPRELAGRVLRAGAVFVGPCTPEAAGDYVAGPSHVLPTGGAARYASPLGVYDFVSRSSVIEYSAQALAAQGPAIEAFARAEGLEAHARAVSTRTSR